MAPKIQILPPELVGKIAAGEVVERPASVVKELLENALDAGATRIQIDVWGGGIQGIRVRDNGCGMSPEDVQLAVHRHATSKIRSEVDLGRIQTLGFRGEALYSIAAVSRLVIQTREPEAPWGTRLETQGGEMVQVREAGCPSGTEVWVRDLFYNVPARRRFLRRPSTEFSHILGLVTRYALACPGVSFYLSHQDRPVLDWPVVSSLRERLFQVYGAPLVDHLLPCEARGEAWSLTGMISVPAETFPDRSRQECFVNGRPVRDGLMAHALQMAYQDLIPAGRHPAAFLFLEVPPEGVDVNVHPTKREVRFRDAGRLHDFLVQGIRKALQQIPSSRSSEVSSRGTRPERSDSTGMVRETPTPVFTRETPRDWTPTPAPCWVEGEPRILGQIWDLYLILELEGDLAILDAHAAHERVLYDRLRRGLQEEEAWTQGLLIPQVIPIPLHRREALATLIPELEALGFQVEEFGPDQMVIRGVPAPLVDQDPVRLLEEILAHWEAVDTLPTREQLLQELTGRRACHQAVRAGMPLSSEAQVALVRQWRQTEMPYTCPHGRPVLWRLSREALDRRFGRG